MHSVPIGDLGSRSLDIIAIDFTKLNDYYCKGYCVFYDNDSHLAAAVTNPTVMSYVQALYNDKNIKFYLISKEELLLILERSFSKLNTEKAKNQLTLEYRYTAKTVDYQKMVAGFILCFASSLIGFTNLFNFINNIIYFSQNILKLILFRRSVITDEQETQDHIAFQLSKNPEDLPIYTVFVPLYKEVRKLKSIIKAISSLDYPKDKLDVKFILEADDTETIAALQTINLPEYIHVIKVPFSLPRTKPKAMNYAMAYVKGEYLCVFDAEDEPDPDQLLKALQAFKLLPSRYACVQARLGYYNAGENILTKFFSLEYSLWFDYLVKALSLYNLPIPLGGTSNHFKVKLLKEVGGWDAYNVTEDAELGIRLSLKGYKVCAIDSKTLEESPISLLNWFLQRVRWIKGFIQTSYVFITIPDKPSKLSRLEIFTIYMIVSFSPYGFLCMPWLIVSFWFNLYGYIYYLWIFNTVISLSYIYYCAYFIAKKKDFVNINIIIVIMWPLYFILHSIAAYWAVLEIVFKPFKWNKTEHGMSEEP